MGVITPLSEQLTKPVPHAMVLVNLKELSTGAYKLLPEGGFCNSFRGLGSLLTSSFSYFLVLFLFLY